MSCFLNEGLGLKEIYWFKSGKTKRESAHFAIALFFRMMVRVSSKSIFWVYIKYAATMDTLRPSLKPISSRIELSD